MVEIDKLDKIRLQDLRVLLQRAGSLSDSQTAVATIHIGGIAYRISTNRERAVLLFDFVDRGGSPKTQRVELLREPSNLQRGEVLWFICPYTGRRCRTLYLDGYIVTSRYAFRHIYSYQRLSRSERLIANIGRPSPERKGGKKTHRGQLSRYGKRLLRYYEREAKTLKGLEQYIEPKKVGRPRKRI